MKRKINWLIAVCMSAAMVMGMGAAPVSAEEETSTQYKTLFKEDFEDTETYGTGNWSNTKKEDFAYSEDYRSGGEVKYYEYLKGDYKDYNYNYSHDSQQEGNTRSYYTMPNMTFRNVNGAKWNRGICMVVTPTKTDWYVDVKLAGRNPEYASMAIGELAKKAIDTSFLFYFRNGKSTNQQNNDIEKMTKTTDTITTNPIKLQLVYKVNGVEKTYELGEQFAYTASNTYFNNGLHIRKSLEGLLEDNAEYDFASEIRVRITGAIEDGLTELGFDNFLIKEADPKEVFSEDFDERPWFGYVPSTSYLAHMNAVDAIDGIDNMTGKALQIESQQAGYNHPMVFSMPNADQTKCYKVSFDLYYPKTNKATSKAVAFVYDSTVGWGAENVPITLAETEKNDNFERFEATFDFSAISPNSTKPKRLALCIKFGDSDNDQVKGDSLYVDNVSVREADVQKIDAVQGNNWFDDENTLEDGNVKLSFRNTENECKGIVAEYKADGSLKNVSVTDVTTVKPADKTITVTEDVTKVSAFMWTLDEASPVISAKVLTKAQ